MEQYYAVKSSDIKGFKIINDMDNITANQNEFLKNNTINFLSYTREYYAKRIYTTNYESLIYVQRETINKIIPHYIILEKIDNEFYEVYTGIKIIEDKDYINSKGLLYQEYYHKDLDQSVININNKQCECYFENWILNNEEKIQILKTFIKESRTNLNSICDIRIELENKKDNTQLDIAKQFIKTLSKDQ